MDATADASSDGGQVQTFDGSFTAIPAAYAYVGNAGVNLDGGNVIGAYALLDPGVLSPIGSFAFNVGPTVVSVLSHPNGKYLYVLGNDVAVTSCGNCNNYINVYSIAGTTNANPGSLTLVSQNVWVTGDYGQGLATRLRIDSSGQLLMAVSYFNVQVFRVNGSDGSLTPRNPATIYGFVAGANGLTDLATGSNQPYAYLVNSSGIAALQAFSINLVSEPALAPVNFVSATQANNASTAIAYNSNFSSLITANAGVGTVSTFPIGSFGSVRDAGADQPAGGPGTNDVVFHPSGLFGYALNGATNQLFAYTYNPGTNVLTPVSSVQLLGGVGAVAIAIEPTGAYLYAVYQNASKVAMFAINPVTAALTALSPPTVTTGTSPSSIAFSAGP